MSHPEAAAFHATAVVIGEAGIVIRGPSGSGKSRLALLLLAEAGRHRTFARLVGDDRVLLRVCGDRLVVAPHPAIAGLIERRTMPFGTVPFAAACVARLIVELEGPGSLLPRYPSGRETTTSVAGVSLPWLRLQGPPDALSCHFVLEALGIRPDGEGGP